MRGPCRPVYYGGGLGMIDTHDKHGYPLGGFFVAHKRFMGHPFPPQGSWGDILDGPQVDDEAVIEAIIEAWSDSQFPPDRDDLRVWHGLCAPLWKRCNCNLRGFEMGNNLQSAAINTVAIVGDVQWYAAMAARYEDRFYAERAVKKLLLAAAELQAALDEDKP